MAPPKFFLYRSDGINHAVQFAFTPCHALLGYFLGTRTNGKHPVGMLQFQLPRFLCHFNDRLMVSNFTGIGLFLGMANLYGASTAVGFRLCLPLPPLTVFPLPGRTFGTGFSIGVPQDQPAKSFQSVNGTGNKLQAQSLPFP